MLPKMSGYSSNFHETKHIYFLIKDDQFFKKCKKIWRNVSNSINKRFDSKSLYHQKYLKTKVKSYEGRINTNFHDIIKVFIIVFVYQ